MIHNIFWVFYGNFYYIYTNTSGLTDFYHGRECVESDERLSKSFTANQFVSEKSLDDFRRK